MKSNVFLVFLMSLVFLFTCENPNRKETKLKKEISSKEKDTTEVFNFIDISSTENIESLEFFTKSIENSSTESIISNGKKYYVVEGDLLMTISEYYQYKKQKSTFPIRLNDPKLLGYRIDNKIVKQPEHLNMKYAIIKSSFKPDFDKYEAVKNNMVQATKDWEGLCNVKFQHMSELDGLLGINDNPDSLTFVIRKAKGDYNAIAFFPHDNKELRKIKVTSQHFKSNYNQVGILRHEIGHALGFLHEHIRLDEDFCRDASTYKTNPVTNYDPKSVMHYYCEGIGTHDLKFTKLDSIGSLEYYPF